MINIGDLPTVQGKRNDIGILANTAYVRDRGWARTCHCCGERVSTYVQKPDSHFVWCLRCW